MFEMMAGRSPFDIVGSSDNPDQNTEDYLFQGSSSTCVTSVIFTFASSSLPMFFGCVTIYSLFTKTLYNLSHVSCSYIGETDPYPSLPVSQSSKCPERLSEQGKQD